MKKFILLAVLICGFLAVNAQKTTGGNYTYIAQRYEWLAGIFKALGLPAGSGPAAFTAGQEQRAGAVYYDSLGADAGFYIWDGTAWVLQGSPGAVALPDELIQPGYVTYSGTGLKFYISPSIARIGGVLYGTDYDSVTLSASDPDDPRKDVIYVATTGIEVLTGTPAGPAAEPQLSAGQIKLTVIDIPALATTPGLTQLPLWDENTEGSVVTDVGTDTDPDNLTNVYHLTKSINVTSINGGDEIIITPSSTINLNAFDGISLFLKLKAILPSTVSITVAGFLTGIQVTPEVGLGFNRNFLPYQGVSLAMTRLTSGASNTFIDKLRFRFAGTATVQAGFYLDYIYLQSGLLQPGSTTSLAMAPIDSKPANPNGGTISNGLLNLNNVTNEYSGLMTPALKAKLDSLRNYLLANIGNGAEILVQVNDTTAAAKSFIVVGGTPIDTDTTFGVDLSGVAAGIDDVLALQQPFTADRKISGNGFQFTIDSCVNINIFSGLEFISSGIGSAIQMSDSVMSLTSSSATDFSTIQTTPTSIKFIAFDGNGSAGDVWTNLGDGKGHWETGGGGGSQNLQSVTDIGNITTDTVNAGAFGVTNGHIFNESGDFTIRGRTGSILFLGADDSNKWFITPSGRLGETGAGDLGAYTFQSTLGTSRFKDLVMEYEAAPGTPSAGLGILYTKSADKKIYWKDDDGIEYDLTDGGGAGISLTTTGSSGVATLVGTVLNVPDYSSGSSIWNGVVIGTTFSATSATINSGAVQWTFTGSSPATFTLPARTSSVNQFYIIKNTGSADLTVAAAGTDDIFTTSSVASLIVTANGGSVMITGAANGTSDLWTALFHSSGTSVGNLIVESIGTPSPEIAVIVPRNDTLFHRLIGTGYRFITVDTVAGTGEIRIGLDTTSATLKAYIAAASVAGNWSLSANALGAYGSFLGSTDAFSLWFKTNNLPRMNLDSAGYNLNLLDPTSSSTNRVGYYMKKGSAEAGLWFTSAANTANVGFPTASGTLNIFGSLINVSTGATQLTVNSTGVGAGGVTPSNAKLTVVAGNTTTVSFKLTGGAETTNAIAGGMAANASNELKYSSNTSAQSRGYVQVNRYVATAVDITATVDDDVIDITAATKTVTLPTAVGIRGRTYTIKLTASGTTGTVATTSSQTIDGSTTYSLSAQYKYVRVISDNANWLIIANN